MAKNCVLLMIIFCQTMKKNAVLAKNKTILCQNNIFCIFVAKNKL